MACLTVPKLSYLGEHSEVSQAQIVDSDLKGAWHYNHVTFTPIAKNFMLYCRLIYMLFILCVRLTIKVKVGIPESLKVGCYPPPPKKTGPSHLKLEEIEGPNARDYISARCIPFILSGSPNKAGYIHATA